MTYGEPSEDAGVCPCGQPTGLRYSAGWRCSRCSTSPPRPDIGGGARVHHLDVVDEEPSWPEPDDDGFAEVVRRRDTGTPVERFVAGLLTDEAMEARPPPEYLIDNVLVRDTLAVLYGASGVGKSFVVMDWGLSVSSGTWWHQRRVVKGRVLFVAAEGSGGLGSRISAWKAANRVYGDAGMLIHPQPVSLLEPTNANVLAQAATKLGVVLVVIDTVARSMPGGDENSAKDMGRLVDNADTIRRASGATVLLVHHTGKDHSAGMRGHSSLRGAVATEVECKGGEGRLSLVCHKQKDDTEFEPIHLGLVRSGGSCVVGAVSAVDDDELTKGEVDLLRTLVEVADEDGVSSSVWRTSSGVAERSFYRWQKGLADRGLAAKAGSKAQARYTPTEQGKRLVESEQGR